MTVNKIQFSFMSEKGKIYGVFTLKRLRDCNQIKTKVTCYVDLEKTINIAPSRLLELVMWKK